MKTMLTFLVDVGRTMNDNMHEDGPKKLSTSLTLIASHMTQRIMASKTVEFSVVTYGSESTNNSLNETQGNYEGIEEIMPMGTKTFAMIEDVYKIKENSTGVCDLIDGIAVAQDILIRGNVGKKYNRVLVVVTDGETEVDPDGMDILNTCVEKMRDDGFIVYFCVLGNSKSAVQVENIKLFTNIASVVANGGIKVLRNLGDGLCFLASGPGLGSKPQQTKVNFQISPTAPGIPCLQWNSVMKQAVPSLKKQSKKSYDPMDPGSGTVKRDSSHRNPNDVDEEVTAEHEVKGTAFLLFALTVVFIFCRIQIWPRLCPNDDC